jgi:hypothetical protein
MQFSAIQVVSFVSLLSATAGIILLGLAADASKNREAEKAHTLTWTGLSLLFPTVLLGFAMTITSEN